MNLKSVLVTGGAGFIGSTFVRQAVAKEYKVIVLDSLTYAGHRQNLDEPIRSGQAHLVEGDICDPVLVGRLFTEHSFDAVVNFAAESHVDRSITGPGEFIETNIKGTFNLLKASVAYWEALPAGRKETYRHVQISTDEVYGSLGPEGKFSETTTLAPNSPYSASKASGDLLTRAWHHTYGLPTLVTNCSNNYGPRQYPEKLIPHMILCAISGKPLPVYGDGANIRDWIHVEDHCSGIWLALEKGQVGNTYCFGGNEERKNLDLVKQICLHLDQMKPRLDGKSYESQIHFVKDRLGHDQRYAIDDSLAQRELGFTRKYRFADGLQQTVKWYLEHSEWIHSVLEKSK